MYALFFLSDLVSLALKNNIYMRIGTYLKRCVLKSLELQVTE